MKRPSRTLSIFTLSALDVLAMATGTFVLIVVLLMPYYRKSFDAQAEIEEVRVESATVSAEAEALQQVADRDRAAAAQAQAEAEKLQSAAAELQAAAAAQQDQTRAAEAETAARQRRIEDLRKLAEQRVVEELDLVFVVDTTRSMKPVLDELAISMKSIVRILERLVPSVRIGFVAYRDRDAGVKPLIVLPLTETDTGLERLLRFVSRIKISPRGSATVEEDMYLGLTRALSMRLRPDAKQSVIVIGDAAAHPWEASKTLNRAKRFARRAERNSLSALYVSTPSSRRFGDTGRGFFIDLAAAGGVEFSEHSGRMIESVLLSVLVD
jgi:Mg-chelatase subunit ChlD